MVDGSGVVVAGVVAGAAAADVVDELSAEEASLELEQAAVVRQAATASARGKRTKRVMGQGYGLISRAYGRGRGNIEE